MGIPIQYAQLPKFKYQSFEPRYQTFDPRTLKSSLYPVTSGLASSVRLTPDKEQETAPAAENAQADDRQVGSTPAEEESSPEAGGG